MSMDELVNEVIEKGEVRKYENVLLTPYIGNVVNEGECIIEGCTLIQKIRHMCGKHYQKWWKEHNRKGARGCSVGPCTNDHYAKGLCRAHYVKMKREEK